MEHISFPENQESDLSKNVFKMNFEWLSILFRTSAVATARPFLVQEMKPEKHWMKYPILAVRTTHAIYSTHFKNGHI